MENNYEKTKYSTILVTGGCGFIGSHVVDKLVKNGYEVIVADINASNYRNDKAKYYLTDITQNSFEKVFEENKIDIVVHLAAQISVSISNKHPLEDANTNIIGTINMLKLAKKYNVKKIIASSSAAVYGDPEYIPVDEKHPVSCLSNYAVSKHTMEEYIKISGVDYIVLRFSNVYGPRQDSEGEAGVISIFISKMIKNENIEIHGTGEQSRDFIYIDDVSNAILYSIQAKISNETVNISSNTECTINQLFNELKKILGYEIEPVYIKSRQGDIFTSVLDNSKAKSVLNFICQKSLSEGLNETAAFIKNN